jgi:hypothetical protein
LLLTDEFLFGSKVKGRRAVVDELGELVAGLGEGVLDQAGGLVPVEPALAIVIPLPVLREPRHVLVDPDRACRVGFS